MPGESSDSESRGGEGEGGLSRTRVWRWGLTAVLAYSLVLLACFAWHVRDQRGYVLELARAHARTAWAKDVDYRRWIAGHGGVYVPMTEKTPPNPHLKVNDREVTLPSGRVLTLVNPAYMTRQVHELAVERAGVIGHITSLKPLRPENAPDGWEVEALRAFEQGRKEVSGIVEVNGESYMRVMRPLVVEQSCLKCHASQGYQAGDIRGGISAAIPMVELLVFSRAQDRILGVGYAVVWILGVTGIVGGTAVIRRRSQERDQAQRELVKARDVAQAAVRAKGAFLANMSHEIRTPMTAILGFTDQLLDGGLNDAERADYARVIRRNGEHLLLLINDILDMSKIEAGKLDVHREACHTRQILQYVSQLFSSRAKEKGLELHVESQGSIPDMINSDSTRLTQALVNLVGNAVKFTSRGAIRVVVSCDRHQETIRFAVVDSGIGLTPEQATRLFVPFAQADVSTSRKYGGTGLGLAITRRIAELLGGQVTLSSKEGQGCTFTLTVPTGPLEGVAMVSAASPGLADTPVPQPAEALPGLTARILLAEDGPDNQRLIRLLLERAGAQVTVVENGRQAVDAGLSAADQGTPFNVILMDMQMPELDGYEATRLLRRRGYEGPIIALTAHAMKGELDECLAAGCDRFLSKPISRDVLIREVAAYAGGLTSVSCNAE
jgi:signal transduction histidine kinase/CheY-like chemotaxis protein